jgi:hypothetical protein
VTTTTDNPSPSTARAEKRAAASASRLWSFSGAIAGLAGLVAIQASLQIDAVYDEKSAGNAERIADRLSDFVPQLLVMHTGLMVATVLMLVFAAGLRRRLHAQAPVGSMLPDVAAFGLVLTSVAGLMGAGFSTEIVFGVTADDDTLDPEFAALVGHWVGTIPWLWVGAGITGVAVAVAALRHSAAPRWIGWTAAVLGGLTLVFGISPLEYMAGFTGPVVVLILGLGFAFGDRASRASG